MCSASGLMSASCHEQQMYPCGSWWSLVALHSTFARCSYFKRCGIATRRNEGACGLGCPSACRGPTTRASYAALLILALSGFVTSFGAHIVATNLPSYAEAAHIGPFMIGLLIGVYDFAELFGKPTASFIADRPLKRYPPRRPRYLRRRFAAVPRAAVWLFAAGVFVQGLERRLCRRFPSPSWLVISRLVGESVRNLQCRKRRGLRDRPCARRLHRSALRIRDYLCDIERPRNRCPIAQSLSPERPCQSWRA